MCRRETHSASRNISAQPGLAAFGFSVFAPSSAATSRLVESMTRLMASCRARSMASLVYGFVGWGLAYTDHLRVAIISPWYALRLVAGTAQRRVARGYPGL